MELFTRDDLRSLLAFQDAACVTITLPADPARPQDAPIRLKNLHREAAKSLESRGLKPQEAARLLEPVEKLIADPLYWREQAGGLAIFLAGDFFQTFRVAMPLDERVSVRDRFMFSPLIPLLAGDGLFYVLTLTQKGVRLLEGRRASLSEIQVDGLPDAAETLEREHRQRGSSVNAYGSGPEEDDRAQIERFFREVDKALQPVLKRSCAPLVLAGVEHIQTIYRAANTYPQLAAGGVPGSPEPLRTAELHPKAWEVVRPIFEREQQAAIGQFEQLASTERASSDPHSIVPAAHYGRVETLFVARGAHQPGRFDSATGKVTVHKTDHPDAEDLLDLAALHTIQNDGRVFALAPDDLPGKATIAAVYRY